LIAIRAMISITQAKQLAHSYLSSLSEEVESDPVVIIDSATIERAFCWVFFYQSREHAESGNTIDCLAGNAPIIVDRLTGNLVATGTTHPIEHYLAEYEASLNQHDA
jgi:hypothetical protein